MPTQQKMPAYIGTKIICAVPLDEFEFAARKDERTGLDHHDISGGRPGYLVVYPDGYESWSPKEVFEKAYRLVSDDERRIV